MRHQDGGYLDSTEDKNIRLAGALERHYETSKISLGHIHGQHSRALLISILMHPNKLSSSTGVSGEVVQCGDLNQLAASYTSVRIVPARNELDSTALSVNNLAR